MSNIKSLVSDLTSMCWNDGFIDGGDIQELLVKHGFIELVTIDAPCGEACICAEVGSEFPTKCYRIKPEFRETRE